MQYEGGPDSVHTARYDVESLGGQGHNIREANVAFKMCGVVYGEGGTDLAVQVGARFVLVLYIMRHVIRNQVGEAVLSYPLHAGVGDLHISAPVRLAGGQEMI